MSDHEVWESQRLGEIAGKISLSGPGNAFVHLLQQQHIGRMVIGNSHNTVRSKPPIDTNGAVNVVSHDAQSHLPDSCHRDKGDYEQGSRPVYH